MTRKIKKGDLTVEMLKSVIHYDPDTGVFTWIKSCGAVPKINCRAGTPHKHGHIAIHLFDTFYSAAQLAFFYMNGRWPAAFMDHINRQPSDNRWCNLREATPQQNAMNTRLRPNNTSGFKGVTWHQRGQKWAAQITISGKLTWLGSFSNKEDAAKAYVAAARLHFGEFASVQ